MYNTIMRTKNTVKISREGLTVLVAKSGAVVVRRDLDNKLIAQYKPGTDPNRVLNEQIELERREPTPSRGAQHMRTNPGIPGTF